MDIVSPADSRCRQGARALAPSSSPWCNPCHVRTHRRIVLQVFAIVVVGRLYGGKHKLDMAFVNQLNMDVFVPALVLV